MADNDVYQERRPVLEQPLLTRDALLRAVESLRTAHECAGVTEGGMHGLNGRTRDLIFGLATAIETVAEMITDVDAEWTPLRTKP